MSYQYATIDIESEGLNRYKHQITFIGVGLAKSLEDDNPKILIYDMSDKDDVRRFKNVMKNVKKHGARTVFQNGKFDTLFTEFRLGVSIPIHEDILLMGTAYDLAAEHKLKKMAQNYLGIPNWDIKTKEKTSRDKTKVAPYLTKDVKYTWELFQFFSRVMTAKHRKIYTELLRPAYRMYRDVERNGLYLHLPDLASVKKKYNKEEKKLLKELNKHHEINWNSAPQVADVLFNVEGMPILKKSQKTGKPSASADVLKELAMKGYELPTLLLQYKNAATRNKMFLNRWEDDCYESRIHPNFNLTNVVSGRTSCSDPNLQQVPKTQDIRALFTGAPGTILFEADYSQLELRIAAHYANEKTMMKIYAEKGDIHTETARLFTSGREPTKEERNKAKAVNFGFLYGMMAPKFVKYAFDSYGQIFTMQEAKHIRDLYFAKYNRLLPWHEEQEVLCEMQGGVANLFGRFRRLPDIYSQNKWERAGAARRAINTPVQGTGSDLLISAATQINKELKGIALIGATVHDSIIGECHLEDKEEVDAAIRRIMLHPKVLDDFGVSLKVPLDIDIGWGPWGTH